MKVDITKKKSMRKHPLLFNYQRGAMKSSEYFLDGSENFQDQKVVTHKEIQVKNVFRRFQTALVLSNCYMFQNSTWSGYLDFLLPFILLAKVFVILYSATSFYEHTCIMHVGIGCLYWVKWSD